MPATLTKSERPGQQDLGANKSSRNAANYNEGGGSEPQILVNITLYKAMKQWFDFYFPSAVITYTLSSVMEHLCKQGLPIEYIEEQFYYNSMAT